MNIIIILTTFFPLLLLSQVDGGDEDGLKRVSYRVNFFREKVKKAMERGQLDLVSYFVRASGLILRSAGSDSLRDIAKELAKSGETIGDFVTFVKEMPFDGFPRLIKETFIKLSKRPPTKSIKDLMLLKNSFPLVVGKLFEHWLDGIKKVTLLPETYESILTNSRSLSRDGMETMTLMTLLSMIRENHLENPLELISKGFWRTGLAVFLASDLSDVKIKDFLAQLIDNPIAFSQLFILKAESIWKVKMLPPTKSVGFLFHNILKKISKISSPVPICQTPQGKTVVFDPVIFSRMSEIDFQLRIDLVYSLISWLTFKNYDILPKLKYTKNVSAKEIFNSTVIKFCSTYDGLYPGIYVDNDKIKNK